MKIFKQTIGFLFILTILLFGRHYLGDLGLFIKADYTGISIPAETTIKESGVVNPETFENGDWDQESVQILSGTVYYLIDILKGILYSIALLFIIIAGFRIITAQGNEDTIKTNRNTIVFAMFGFIIILLADTAVRNVFYGDEVTTENGEDFGPGSCLFNPSECATKGAEELLGIVYWWKTLLAVIAFIEIIVSGIRMIMAIGAEDIIEKEKKVFIWVSLGLLLLAINEVVIEKVLYVVDEWEIKENDRLKIDTDLQQGINEFVGVIQFILQFVAFFAFVSLVYGGFLMVVNFGDDERVSKAKGIIRDAIIGIIVSFSAYAIVSTIVMKAS